MVLDGLGWLARAEIASVPASVRADCLRELERIESVFTAARASVLSAFDHDAGYQDDGQGTARTWLRWQTRITNSAASAAVGWMRRLRAHRLVAEALREGRVSASIARQICDWTDKLPESARDDADAILLGAAVKGARLEDLANLVDQMRRMLARPDRDSDDGFEDRRLRLATTFDGAGKLDGDLTSECAAAVQAVLDALGKKAGPEDTRTIGQRHHDALAEACRRLVASGCLPDRAGQPTKIQLHISLEELTRRRTDQADPAGSSAGVSPSDDTDPDGGGGDFRNKLWPRIEPGSGPIPGMRMTPEAPPGAECDASIEPVVSGLLDHELLDQLVALLTGRDGSDADRPDDISAGEPTGEDADEGPATGCSAGLGNGRPAAGRAAADQAAAVDANRVRGLIIANAAAILSGPGGLASLLRTGTLTGSAASVSLPLDIGIPTEVIPPHLRRAVILRDQHCRAPGCQTPAAGCQVHHIRPRSRGGLTQLSNLLLMCPFHHLILIHTWGWTITLNPDGTTTMSNPSGTKVYHSHSPPSATAA